MRTICLTTICAIGVLAADARAQSGFTIDQVMSAPFPSGVTAARGNAGRAAWVSLHRGARSVWLADLASSRATRVANFAGDDGQDLSALEVARSGSALAFVRGQGYNRWRENPNPSSDPDGGEQAVWVVAGCGQAAASCGAQRRIGRGWSPRLSPDGRRVVYQLDSTLMIASTSGATPPRRLFAGRGVNTDAQWSPDGRMVAFTSSRDDHSYVGVYDVARDSIRWMAAGVDRDVNPRWSPDGKRLAFTRTDGGPGGGNVFAPRPGNGFGIMIADPTDGSATEIWHSQPGIEGRLRNPTAGESFLWSGSRLLFFMEADGWQHLYSIVGDGARNEPVQLTKGECEVEEPWPTPDGSIVYYSANCEDIDRKHIWRVAVAGGSAPERVTRGETIEYAPAISGSRLLFLRADARRPPAPVLMTLEGREVALAGAPATPASFPAEQLVEPRPVTFKAEDGLEIHGQLFVPRDARNAPAVIFMHGGPPRQMLLGWHPRGYYNRAYGMNQYLASRGYVVLAVNYRLGVGYGRAFREAERGGRRGASEYQDIVAGGRYLQSLPFVDGARIGLWGGSYGGYLTAYGMAKNPELFKVGVDLHGVHDWNARFSNFAPATMAAREADSVLAIGRASSPVCCVSSIAGPILFIHGDDDRNVAFSETVNLIQMMRAEKKPFEVIAFPDEVHDFLRHANWLTTYRATAAFFDKHLMRTNAAASPQ